MHGRRQSQGLELSHVSDVKCFGEVLRWLVWSRGPPEEAQTLGRLSRGSLSGASTCCMWVSLPLRPSNSSTCLMYLMICKCCPTFSFALGSGREGVTKLIVSRSHGDSNDQLLGMHCVTRSQWQEISRPVEDSTGACCSGREWRQCSGECHPGRV